MRDFQKILHDHWKIIVEKQERSQLDLLGADEDLFQGSNVTVNQKLASLLVMKTVKNVSAEVIEVKKSDFLKIDQIDLF